MYPGNEQLEHFLCPKVMFQLCSVFIRAITQVSQQNERENSGRFVIFVVSPLGFEFQK